MRVLVVSQYFWPENFRINDLCSELVKRGHKVTVLTGKPNYPDGVAYPEFIENPLKYSRFEGAKIIRVPMVARGQGSSLKLFFNYISFAFSASLWGWIKLRKIDFDVTFVFEPSPITVGLPAIWLRKTRKIPVIFWVLDLWPETLEAVGVIKSRFLLCLVGKLVSFIYRRCDLILGQSKSFLDGIALYCDKTEKIKYFPNWPEGIFSINTIQRVEAIAKFDGTFKVLFAGNIGEAQDFPSILAAAAVLKNSNASIKIFIVGDGRMMLWVKQQIEERGLQDFVCLMGLHPLEMMPSFYASADALLVSLKESRVFSMTVPGKVQSYMMAEKPILAMLDGEGALAINEANAGYTCCAEDHEALAKNILAMSKLSKDELQKFGVNAKSYAQREFDRSRLISQLEQWFSGVAISKNSNINEA